MAKFLPGQSERWSAGSAQSSLSDRQGITVITPLQRGFLGALAVKLSVSKGEKLEIQKNSLVTTKGKSPLDIYNAPVSFVCDMTRSYVT